MEESKYKDRKSLRIGLLCNAVGLVMVSLNSMLASRLGEHSWPQILMLVMGGFFIGMGVVLIFRMRIKDRAGRK